MTPRSFLLSERCPINLMERDLMCHFSIVLTSYPDQLKITRMPVGRVQAQFHHSMSMSGLSWCHLVVNLMNIQASAYSHTESLHCTAHVSEGPNDSFEEEPCGEGNEVEQPELMSQHENDVGLMKDTTPPIINPKSDFHPSFPFAGWSHHSL